MPFSKKRQPETRDRGKSETSRVQLVVMGPGGVGKSCLVLRIIMGDFVEDYDPTIEDNYRKTITVDHKPLILDIMDTAGQEDFSMLEDQWIRMGEGFLLVFDVMDPSTVSEVEFKYNKIIRQKEMENVPVVLVGNKMDKLTALNQTDSAATQQAKRLANKWGCHYMETSAKSNENVSQCFDQGVRSVREWRKATQQPTEPERTPVCWFL